MSSQEDGKFRFSDLFLFNKFITPLIMTVLFCVAVVVLVIGSIFYGYIIFSAGGGFLLGLLCGLSSLIVGFLVLRIATEYILVVFDIRKNLREINNKIN